jgi:type I restriction enzyme S subunit
MTAAPSKSFAVWFKNLERWSVDSFTSIDWRWPISLIRPLSDALIRKSLDVEKETAEPCSLKLVTLHFNGEMELRQQRGNKPIKGRLWWADPGDVIYSKIDVRHGAIGIVPDEFGRVCVTSEFPVYTVDSTATDARYIKLLFRTVAFRRKINSMISGTSGRKRVQPGDLEDIKVPLPPLSAQKSIVSKWSSAQDEIADIQTRISNLEDQIEINFLASLGLHKPKRANLPKAFGIRWKDLQQRWGVDVNQQALCTLDPEISKYQTVRLGEVIADLENGWSPKCLDRPANPDEWGILKLGAVSFGFYNEQENKALPANRMKPRPNLEVRPGDWLISRANITRLVGACALVRKTNLRLMLCDKIFRAVWRDPSPILSEYLDEIMKIPQLRQQIENNVTGTSATMKNITKPSLLGLRIPLPPLSVQYAIMEKTTAQRKIIAELKSAADERSIQAKADMDAMILGTKPVLERHESRPMYLNKL